MDDLRAGRGLNWVGAAQGIIDGTILAAPALLWAQSLEDEIERRGVWRAYALELEHICVIDCNTPHYLATNDGYGIWWFLIRATPEQRARAFLKVAE